MRGLNAGYPTVFKEMQSLFILRCHLMKEFIDEQNINLHRLMYNSDYFNRFRKQVVIDKNYMNKQTLVIDLMDTLITPVDIKSMHELRVLKNEPNFESNYILLDNEHPICCQKHFITDCTCRFELYSIRPYTLSFLRSLQPFFELITYTNIETKKLEKIVSHFEFILNQECPSIQQQRDQIFSEQADRGAL